MLSARVGSNWPCSSGEKIQGRQYIFNMSILYSIRIPFQYVSSKNVLFKV